MELDWGANDVRVPPESVKGGARLIGPATLKLEPREADGEKHAAARNPPGTITLRADGLPSEPTLRCDLDALAAISPSPPPPPPHCGAPPSFQSPLASNRP